MKRKLNSLKLLASIFVVLSSQNLIAQPDKTVYIDGQNWDNFSQWSVYTDGNSTLEMSHYGGLNNDGIQINYNLNLGINLYGWAVMQKKLNTDYNISQSVTLHIKAEAHSDIELKFIDEDGSVFGKRYSIKDRYSDWNSVVIYVDNSEYWWGGDSTFGTPSSFEIAFSGTGSGAVWIDEIGIGKSGLLPGLFLDPYRESGGIGFRQRRSLTVTEEDSAVIRFIELLQDSCSTDKKLLPSYETGVLASTYDNSLAAMVFILKYYRERAEKILDFYASAIDSNNQDVFLQNFYFNREKRGFYQQVNISDHRASTTEDRWIGDMAWLLIAYKFYEKTYCQKDKYKEIIELLEGLLISFYKPLGSGGYIQHGWRDGDSYLHENEGHIEGNIDCYAALKLCGEEFYAEKIKIWLDSVLTGNNMWLDEYSWRVLAFGESYKDTLNIPEYDFRYRKILNKNGKQVMGFFSNPNIDINNVWNDATGHMACAFINYGEKERAYFYSNQLDPLLVEYELYGEMIKALPYTANKKGGYEWIDTTRGSLSSSAWYIFAKNGFNPLNPFRFCPIGIDETLNFPTEEFKLYPNYPNPFNPTTTIQFTLAKTINVELKIFDLLGQEIITLLNESKNAGVYNVVWNGNDDTNNFVPSGVYICNIKAGNYIKSLKMILLR